MPALQFTYLLNFVSVWNTESYKYKMIADIYLISSLYIYAVLLSDSEVNDQQILDEAVAVLSEKPVSTAQHYTSSIHTCFPKKRKTANS